MAVLASAPDHVQRRDVVVLQRSGRDELASIQALWPDFEQRVGLRGRRMFAQVHDALGTYTVCTPLHPDDDPGTLGVEVGTLPGGRYLRGRLRGEPPAVYASIGPAMAELERVADRDPARPLVEFYRRHDQIELWVPVLGS